MKSYFLSETSDIYIKFSEIASISTQNQGQKYCIQLIGGRNFVILDKAEGQSLSKNFKEYLKNPKAAEAEGFDAT